MERGGGDCGERRGRIVKEEEGDCREHWGIVGRGGEIMVERRKIIWKGRLWGERKEVMEMGGRIVEEEERRL